jgi:hypothetical protein
MKERKGEINTEDTWRARRIQIKGEINTEGSGGSGVMSESGAKN